jgi:hypothetical protein
VSTAKYECVAVTAEIPPSRRNPAGLEGYPFWARLYVTSGKYVWCKINPLPGESAVGSQAAAVALPEACDLQRG